MAFKLAIKHGLDLHLTKPLGWGLLGALRPPWKVGKK